MERLVIEVPTLEMKNAIHEIAKRENKSVKDLLVEILEKFIARKNNKEIGCIYQ